MKYATASLRLSLEDNGVPLYQQLIQQIQTGIESEELAAGDKLPSSRLLAESLGVSRSTVSRVYDQLISEGVLVSEEKRGVFVSALFLSNPRPQKEVQKETRSKKEIQYSHFDSGVDTSEFPVKEWSSSMRRSWLKPDLTLLQGGYSTGYPALKDAIVDYLYRVRGLDCVADQIIVTAGNRDSLMLLQHALSNDVVSQNYQKYSKKTHQKTEEQPLTWWLESPTYPPIREAFSQQTTGYLDVNEEGVCLPLGKGVNAVVITPNRHYPLGVGLSSQRRQLWLQKLQVEPSNLWVIEDDYDNEFVYQGRSEAPLMQAASLHEKARDRVFFVGSFSKVLFRGLRMGFIVVPQKQIERLKESQKTLGSSASLPIQPAVADFMLQGSFDRHINRMRRRYRMKRDFLLTLLEESLMTWFTWKKPRGGMHILIEFKADVLADKLSAGDQEPLDKYIAEQLKLQNVQLSTLSSHYQDDTAARCGFVLGFSGATEDTMKDIVLALKRWLIENG